ncbi:unnamed protein product [Blepharisma stoltei]|uniref:Anaphase-promoting complex subunit 4 WD40 domain-containing protein n=1 Tax=Blepharisma stoltei TaxID=1481888 RepID=A0AAU9IK21_9CILI|nr:unnamed protein product [Blepharisma stoltei]
MKTKGLPLSKRRGVFQRTQDNMSSRYIETRKPSKYLTNIQKDIIKYFEVAPETTDFMFDCDFLAYNHRYDTSCDSILDAPDITHDFSSNILSYDSKNYLAMGLCNQIYILDSETGNITTLLENPENCINSLSWQKNANSLIFSNTPGKIRIYDIERLKNTMTINLPLAKCCSITAENNLITCGLENGSLIHTDIRSPKCRFLKKGAHSAAISGQDWSISSNLATIGLDHKVNIWEIRAQDPIASYNIGSPGKSISWNPIRKDILACGGNNLSIINYSEESIENTKDLLEEKIGGICWNSEGNSIVCAQGKLLKVYDTKLRKCCSFEAHADEIYFLSKNSNQDIATAGLDETLRFWNILKQ